MKISQQDLELYLNGGKKHSLYKETVDEYNKLNKHYEGKFDKEKLGKRRPSETDEILQYREDTHEAVTKLPIGRVIGSLGKIRSSPDWSISFDPKAVPAKVANAPGGETLEQYSQNIPGYGSITDWAFSLLLKNNAIDSNAVVLTVPLAPLTDDAYCKPIPLLFNSPNVWAFDEYLGFAVLKSEGRDRIYYVDNTEIIIYEKLNGQWVTTLKQTIPFGEMPAYRLRAERTKEKDGNIINKSRLEPMAAFLNLESGDHSDFQGSKIQSLYPLFWYYQNIACPPCNGSGKLLPNSEFNTTDQVKTCGRCQGTGKVPFSPYAHIRLEAPALDKQAVPNPPAGYIGRDTDVLRLQREEIEINERKAYAAVHHEYLANVPLNTSGESKKVDRQELENWVKTFGEDIVWAIDRTFYFMCQWRYSYVVPNVEERRAMLPKIPVPQTFDLLSIEYWIAEIKAAIDSGASPFIIAQLQQDFAARKFYNNPEVAANTALLFQLDPLQGMSADDKMTNSQNGFITKEDAVISTYMAQFINRAIWEDSAFSGKPRDAQIKVLIGYAKEKITAMDTAAQVADEAKQKVLEEMKISNAAAAV